MTQQQRQGDRYADYVPVAERVELFYQRYPQGRIVTTILEHERETGFVLVRAEAFRALDDALPAATGHAYEVRGESFVNKTSYVENCETGAVGRALALLGFEVKRGIASREEAQKAERQQTRAVPTQIERAPGTPPVRAVEPSRDADRDIMTALEILGKTEDWLNERCVKQLNWRRDWTDLPPNKKGELLAGLNALIDKKVAEAKG